jgi:hypothetical protein
VRQVVSRRDPAIDAHRPTDIIHAECRQNHLGLEILEADGINPTHYLLRFLVGRTNRRISFSNES